MTSKPPTEKALKKWKEQYPWFHFTESKKLVCSICTSQEECVRSMPNFSSTFIVGSTNYRLSSLKDHDTSLSHQRALREEEHEKASAEGINLPPRKVVQNVPSDSAIAKCFQQMGEKEKETVEKLHEIAFYIALKGHPFTDFQDHIQLEKLHGVKYTGAYENESACKDFMFCISEYLFEESVKKKLLKANFVAILCDGSTDASVTEQEVIYVVFVDPETGKPTLTFFEVVAPSENQAAHGLKEAIVDAFKRNSLESVVEKIVFLSSDGASVNCERILG